MIAAAMGDLIKTIRMTLERERREAILETLRTLNEYHSTLPKKKFGKILDGMLSEVTRKGD